MAGSLGAVDPAATFRSALSRRRRGGLRRRAAGEGDVLAGPDGGAALRRVPAMQQGRGQRVGALCQG